jgi:hypothetical protein
MNMQDPSPPKGTLLSNLLTLEGIVNWSIEIRERGG